MFHFERTTTVKSVADMPAAMQFASEVTAYLNKQHGLKMKFGAELFDQYRVHWFFEFDSVDKLAAMGAALLQDAKYNEMLSKARGLWVDGSLRDTIVNVPS